MGSTLKTQKKTKKTTRTAKLKSSSYARASIPSTQRTEDAEFESKYHANDVCGSNFHGLATTIQRLIQEGRLNEAIEQVRRCIEARKAEQRRKGFDSGHNEAIQSLKLFLIELQTLDAGMFYTQKAFPTMIVKYSDTTRRFSIIIGNYTFIHSGGKRIKHNKNKKRKTRKNNKKM
jgi:hypothetical protein